MIIPTVLGCVAVAFAWMLQYQNGGVLNVFMKPIPSTSIPNGISFDVQTDFSGLSTQIMNIVWGRLTKADLTVLAALPENVGGGEKAVAKAIAHPNNEGKLIVAFIVCLVFASLGLLAIFVVSFVCCCCCSSCGRDDDESSTNDQNFICCGLHILAFVMTALLLVGLVVCIGYYFGAASVVGETLANSQATDDEVIVWLWGNVSSFSINRIMEFAVSKVETFVTTSIESAKTDVNKTINTVTKNLLEVTLPDEITSLLTALMTNFKVMEIVEAVDDLVYAILNATEYSDYIWEKYNLTVPTIVNKSLELNFLLNSTITNCSANPSEVLRNKFNPAKVVPVPSELTLVLDRTHSQLQELKLNLDNITQHLKDVQEEAMKELESKLDMQQILGGMYDLIGNLEEQFNQISVQINTMTGKVSGYLGQYAGTAKAVIYALCVPCLLAGILFLVLLTLYLLEAIRRHLFSITGESASEASGTAISQSRVGGGGMFCFCSALLLVPIILIGLVAVVTVTVGGFMHAEVCPYVGNTSGLRMTDFVVNSKIDVVWNDLIVSQLSGGEAAGNNFADILNLKAPQNLLHAVEVGCNPQNKGPTSRSGLLPKMGIDNLVNISALLESPTLTEGIEKTEQGLVDGIVNAKLGNKIPDAILVDVQNFTYIFQKLVAFLNISDSIKELQENVFKPEEIKAFADSLNPKCDKIAQQLRDLLPALEESNSGADQLRKAYEGLNNSTKALGTTELVKGIFEFKNLTVNANAVSKALKNPLNNFTTALFGSVNEIGTEAFANLTESLLPCDSLHYAVQSVVFMGCGASGLAPRVFAWGLFLSLCLFFTFFGLLSLCLLWRVQTHQVKRFGGSEYSDNDDD